MATVRERREQFKRLAQAAIADLFDQRQPFGRLALTHVLMTAGDTIFAVSLAGSLFFSISPTAAQDKVLLYLLLTMAPFAVVAPALGPLIDRSRGARRGMVVVSALGRAALCPLLARDIHSLLLFPLAFAMLVLSKVYLVTKGALVPEMASLGLIGHPPGSDPPGTVIELVPTSPPSSTPPYGTPMTGGGVEPEDSERPNLEGAPDLAGLNARLGLLASLSAFVFALPAVGMLKLAGASGVLWLDFIVFLAAVVAGARLPVRQRRRARGVSRRRVRERAIPMVSVTQSLTEAPAALPAEPTDDEMDLAAFRPIATSEVLLALMPMSVLKAELGFLTFLLAFGLRRQGAATWWFGLLLGAITAGALIGVLLVARLRKVFSEQQILVASLWLVAVFAGIISLQSSRYFQIVVALAVGVAGAISKPSFDALVQRHVEVFNQGRAFARFETRLQLVWVVGAFVPVVVTLPISTGDLIMAIVAALGAVAYMSSLRSGSHRW
ncbi:MAG TPA: MFS transporter [Acidimicrobiales bacterium]|nr:MFS transporter [Acidimicrobiales bacterium]